MNEGIRKLKERKKLEGGEKINKGNVNILAERLWE